MSVVGHGSRLVLDEPCHAAHSMAPAMAAPAVEVAQIQFIVRGCASSLHGGLGPWFCRLRGCGRPSHISLAKLDSEKFSTSPLCLAVFQSALAFGRTSRENLDIISTSPSYSAGGTFRCAVPGSTVDTCHASAPGCVGRFAHILFVKRNSDPEVVSRPALLVVFVLRRIEKGAQLMLQVSRVCCT